MLGVAIPVGEGILGVVQWLAANPQVFQQGEDFVLGLINDAISIYNTWKTSGQSHDELLAQWVAAGIPIQAVRDSWRSRHPLGATGGA